MEWLHVQVTSLYGWKNFEKLNEMILKTNAIITRLDIWFDKIKPVILNEYLEYVQIGNGIYRDIDLFKSLTQFFKQSIDVNSSISNTGVSVTAIKVKSNAHDTVVFAKLKVIDLVDSSVKIEVLIQFLQFISEVS